MIKRYFSPSGLPIIGTREIIPAIAVIEGIDSVTGEAIYTGDTTVQWDKQETVKRKQQAVFVDSSGAEYSFTQLKAANPNPQVVGMATA